MIFGKKEFIEKLCKEFDIAILYAFGSRSKEVLEFFKKEKEKLSSKCSDADIGVKTTKGKRLNIQEKVQLAILFEELLGVNQVDLVDLSEADPFLAAEIIRGERIFARSEVQADEYELYVLRRAGDLIPLERERQRLIFKED